MYRVIPSSENQDIAVPAHQVPWGQFFGYLTPGGVMAVLMRSPRRDQWEFRYVPNLVQHMCVGEGGKGPSTFAAKKRDDAINKAVDKGREVYAAESMHRLLCKLTKLSALDMHKKEAGDIDNEEDF